MNNLNLMAYGHEIIKESVRGGAAYYRPAHHATNRFAQYRVEPEETQAAIRGRVAYVKLLWLFAIIKLPRWSPIGTPLQ